MLAGQDLGAGAGPRLLLVDLRRPVVPQRVVQVSGEQRGMVRLGARAIDDDVLAPAVEDVAVRVGEAEIHVHVELLRARLVAVDAGVGVAHRRAPGRLHLRVVERAFLEIDRAPRIEDEAVGGVVRVGGV